MAHEDLYPIHAAALLTRRAELSPDRVGLVDVATGLGYTYTELNTRANRLANWLIGLGVEKGDRVSILAHNCIHTVLLYGLAKIGAILAPLNWRLTSRELAYIVGDCAPKVFVCGPEFTSALAELRPGLGPCLIVGIEGARIEGALAYEEGVAAASASEPVCPSPVGCSSS